MTEVTQTFKFWKTIAELGTLAVRAMANELTDEEKKSIDQEVQELKAKLKDTIDAKQNNFKGRKLIDESTKQVDKDNEKISI